MMEEEITVKKESMEIDWNLQWIEFDAPINIFHQIKSPHAVIHSWKFLTVILCSQFFLRIYWLFFHSYRCCWFDDEDESNKIVNITTQQCKKISHDLIKDHLCWHKLFIVKTIQWASAVHRKKIKLVILSSPLALF